MQRKGLTRRLHEASDRQHLRLPLAARREDRASVSLRGTVHATMPRDFETKDPDAPYEAGGQSQRPVLIFAGDIPLDLKVLAEDTGSQPETIGFAVPPSEPPAIDTAKQPGDSWSDIEQSARHLGISTSTLYKYSSQRKIESRKVAGRLQFRQSQLDEFLEQQIRPARKARGSSSIISSALCSGK
jgi:Helix-turn-helix domain